MPGNRGSERRALPGEALVRLTAEADALLGARAAAADLTRSAWARGAIVDALALSVEHRRPVRAHRRKQAPAEDLAAIAKLAAALNRNNGASIQLAKVLRETGASDLHHEVEQLITVQERAIGSLFRLVERLKTLDAEAVPADPIQEAA